MENVLESAFFQVVTLDDYLRCPCRASSLPYWKSQKSVVPDNMLIIRDDAFSKSEFMEYEDTPYFKLIHELKHLRRPVLGERFDLGSEGIDAFARHIHECYGGGVSTDELQEYTKHPVYDPNLWLAIIDSNTGSFVASGIAELDSAIGEGVLEWIQVSPDYRGMGLWSFLVRELLWRMKDVASFVTVSGMVNNKTDPLGLYLSCGFSKKVIWHVLTKR